MIVAGIYSFNNGHEVLQDSFRAELDEIKRIISTVNSRQYQRKISKEKTMLGKSLYSPRLLNKGFRTQFTALGWDKVRIPCEYTQQYYTQAYQTDSGEVHGAFREMDFVKNRVGVEVQFGKYAFMVYNDCAKMTIFHNYDFIDVGIEIVPVKTLANDMSTGVSYFEQIVWDLEKRGVADIDLPVMIIGVAPEPIPATPTTTAPPDA
jgi:hypothetical protein